MNKKHAYGILALLGTAALSCVFVAIPSDTLIAKIGTQNVFLFMYVIAVLGSITTFASIPYPLILIGLAAGGIDPLAIGIVSALGVITSDSITFFATKKGSALIPDSIERSLTRIATYIEHYPKLITPALMLYGIVSPFSNDFAVISFSLMRYAYFRVVLPLAVGNIIYNVGLAYFGVYAYDWIVNLL